jgi:hypothetical protein
MLSKVDHEFRAALPPDSFSTHEWASIQSLQRSLDRIRLTIGQDEPWSMIACNIFKLGTALSFVANADLAGRMESHMRREGKPIGLSELRRSLGISPERASELSRILRTDERFYKVGSLWYVRRSPLKIRVRFCPNCGHKKVRYQGGFYTCANCELRFHFTWLL